MISEKVKEKIEEYINNKVECVRFGLESRYVACGTTLAYLQALADVELITMDEYNFYLGTLTERLYG